MMKIDRLFLDNSVKMDEEVEYIISAIGLSPERVDHPEQIYKILHSTVDPIKAGKKVLFITENKGAIIKECPGTSVYTCCEYTILHSGTFCTMDCSYCILQAYFHPPVLQYFAGFNKIKGVMKSIFAQDKIFRIGTGEYTDSLIWEKISPLPQNLINLFADSDNSVLELKTKTINIDSLLSLEHNGKTILAWSLNTPEIIKSEEIGTASLQARLKAARRASQAGFKLAFHFDPVVIYPGSITAYKKVIKKLFESVEPDKIVWISIGSFRFMPKLKQIIEKRFKSSTICYGEFIIGLDNKMRYFKPIRIKAYQSIVNTIKQYAPDVFIYFCMEDEEVWKKCIGYFPSKPGELGALLDKQAVKHCGLNPEKAIQVYS